MRVHLGALKAPGPTRAHQPPQPGNGGNARNDREEPCCCSPVPSAVLNRPYRAQPAQNTRYYAHPVRVPKPETLLAADRNEIALGGCHSSPTNPDRVCRNCGFAFLAGHRSSPTSSTTSGADPPDPNSNQEPEQTRQLLWMIGEAISRLEDLLTGLLKRRR